MSIEQNIRDMQKEIGKNKDKGNELKKLAVAGIYAGFGSPEWKAFMKEFAKTPQELARLTTKNGDAQSDYIKPARAYLLGNATCLPGTGNNLLQGIEGFLDKTLQ